MKLVTKDIERRLLRNGADREADHKPVVKFFTPDGSGTWLISRMDPEDPDLLFGLADLGMGFPETGNVRLSELASARGPRGLPIERDMWFEPKYPLSVYWSAARGAQRIVEGGEELDDAARRAGLLDADDGLPSPSP